MAYATVDQVEGRNPYRPIGASTSPSTSQVEEWLEEAEAEVDATLSVIGTTSPCTNATGIKILRNRIVTYVAGLVAQAYAAAGGDGGNDDGADAVEKWEAFLEDLLTDAVAWAGKLEGGSVSSSAIKARSHTTHNRDSLTTSAGDFSPRFAKDSPEDQF